jgi:putative transposase
MRIGMGDIGASRERYLTWATISRGAQLPPFCSATAPGRSRKTTWKEFLTQHCDLIVAADFFSIEAWTRVGLERFVILFFIELSTRRVEIAGIASNVNGMWMSQIGRNLTDSVDGLLKGKRYLIHDRDPLFTAEFLNILAETGVASVRIPPR